MVIYTKALRLIKLWFGLGLLWVAVVIYFSITPSPPDTSGIEFGDKIFHTLGYFCLFFWFGQIYRQQYLWRPGIALVLLGIVLEFVQYGLGYRTLEFADMIANTSGVLIGWLMARMIFSDLFVYFEKLFLASRA